jgi:hypothetical protein
MRKTHGRRLIATILSMILLLTALVSTGMAQTHRRYRHHHSTKKGAIIGGLAGAAAGGLVGGRKGVLIGGAGGAGTGYLVQRHRNRRYRRHY